MPLQARSALPSLPAQGDKSSNHAPEYRRTETIESLHTEHHIYHHMPVAPPPPVSSTHDITTRTRISYRDGNYSYERKEIARPKLTPKVAYVERKPKERELPPGYTDWWQVYKEY